MSEHAAGWAFADAFAVESAAIEQAREASAQFGVTPVSPAVGAALALAAASAAVGTMIEIGTGVGVSGLWLLCGAPDAQLTTIDVDLDQHQVARGLFAAAGHAARRTRFITGLASAVLPRMNEGSYDLVFLDAGAESLREHVDASLRLVRPGGSVLVAHVLQSGKVSNPARRDRATVAYRELLRDVQERDDLLAAVSPAGDGLLHLIRS